MLCAALVNLQITVENNHEHDVNLQICHQSNVDYALVDHLLAVKDLPEHVELFLID